MEVVFPALLPTLCSALLSAQPLFVPTMYIAAPACCSSGLSIKVVEEQKKEGVIAERVVAPSPLLARDVGTLPWEVMHVDVVSAGVISGCESAMGAKEREEKVTVAKVGRYRSRDVLLSAAPAATQQSSRSMVQLPKAHNSDAADFFDPSRVADTWCWCVAARRGVYVK